MEEITEKRRSDRIKTDFKVKFGNNIFNGDDLSEHGFSIISDNAVFFEKGFCYHVEILTNNKDSYFLDAVVVSKKSMIGFKSYGFEIKSSIENHQKYFLNSKKP